MDATTVRSLVARELGVRDACVRREHSGGSGSACFRVEDRATHTSLFVKVSATHAVGASEAASLRALAATQTVRVPRVVCVVEEGRFTYLVLEYLAMARATTREYAALGDALGRLHTRPPPQDATFGFAVDNYLGATPQKNLPRDADWRSFFKQQRLQFQLDLLRDRGRCRDKAFLRRVATVLEHVDLFFDRDETVRPSLLHGDLWQGNWGFLAADKQPVLFDPASFWGHSEAELAMMTLFGDLPDAFYAAYEVYVPRGKRFAERVPLYQLYHALNHYNLFGAGYQSLCEALLTRLETTITRVRETREALAA